MKKTTVILGIIGICISLMAAGCSDDGNAFTETAPGAIQGGNSGGKEDMNSGNGSSNASDLESIPENENPASGNEYAAQSSIYINLTKQTCSEDGTTWSSITTSKTKLLSKTVNVKFTEDEDSNSTGLIKIDLSDSAENISVNLAGTLLTGGVKIQTNPEHETGVYLNGVSITSSNYPALEITKGGAATVFLRGENFLADGRSYGTGYGEEYSTDASDTYEDDDGNIVSCTVVQKAVREGSDSKGTLYCKGSMTICGTGSLTVKESYKHCIVSKSYLTIESGTYDLVSTGKSGFYGDCGVTVKDGTISFSGSGEISSSKYHKCHAFNVDDDTYSDAFVKIYGGTLNLTAYNGKGINAPVVNIYGGNIAVDASGVTGYTKDDRKTASYYDADGVKYTNASVTFSAEGIEGASLVEITGGTIEVTATDDAFNVSDTGALFTMSGGMVYAYSVKGDAVDSNGNIRISGGTLVAYAPTGSEDALDCGDGNYSVSITGGTVAGVCGSSNGAQHLSASGNQHILYGTGSSGGMGGMGGNSNRPGSSSSSDFANCSNVVVQIASATKLCFTVPSSNFGLIVLTSPEFTGSASSNYTVYTAASISGGEAFHGLYTSLPEVLSTGTGRTMSVK